MATPATNEGAIQHSEPATTALFQGKRLWFSHKIPTRGWLIENAQLHGAQIVPLEKQADIRLVDHLRKPHAPGTHSYRYVEESIRKGQLEDLDTHRVGSASRVERPVGSLITAPKGTRNKFTEAEDQLLWNWIKPYADAGGAWKGLEIYKQLESINPNHTYQSWRDRWIKHTQYQNRQVTAQDRSVSDEPRRRADAQLPSPKRRRLEEPKRPEPYKANISVSQPKQGQSAHQNIKTQDMGNTESSSAAERLDVESQTGLPPRDVTNIDVDVKPAQILEHQPADGAVSSNVNRKHDPASQVSEDLDEGEQVVSADGNRLPLAFDFTQKEARMLYRTTCEILDTCPDKVHLSWESVVTAQGHTQDAWQTFFYDFILPEYKKRRGIETEEELKTHYEAKLRANREQEEREAALAQRETIGNRADAEQSARDLRNSTNETEQQPDDAQAHGASIRIKHEIQLPSLLLRVDENHPPRPNESRKLGQARGSQSTSSQSQSQSQSLSLTTSQPSQHSQQLAPIQGQTGVVTTTSSRGNAIQDKLFPEVHLPADLPCLTQPRPFTEQEQGLKQQAQNITQASQQSEEQDVYSNRFVTQLSHSQQLTSTESSALLEDIPHREETPPRPRTISESPLFVPEDPETLSLSYLEENYLEPQSSSPAIQLVDEEEAESARDRFSDYAPSETPSEGIKFESQLRLSQAWETAPEGPLADEHTDRNDEWTTEDDFETALPAPTKLPSEPHDKSQQGANKKLDTQALFQQPTQANLAELIAIPEPPGGWDDEDSLADHIDLHNEVTKEHPSETDADWTLPFPDPDMDLDITAPSPPKESDVSTDMDAWLANQPQIHATMPRFLLQPLCHRALESTSMDLDLATFVLTRMVRRFEKGKHSDHTSLRNIRKLPKKERKEAVAKIAEELVPGDMRGCWTRDDDKALLSSNGREVKSVDDKHGERSVQDRFEFLEMWHSK